MAAPKPKTNLRSGGGGRAVHDLGGLADGAIDRHEHALSLFEKRVDALVNLLRDNKRNAFSVDAMRRVIESTAEQEYDRISYYEKWMRAIRTLLLEQEIVSAAELAERIKQARAAFAAEGRKVSRRKVP